MTDPAALDRAIITEANNSLYGSQNYFTSLNGSPGDKYHLAREIEGIKAYGRKQYQRAEQAEQKLADAVKVLSKEDLSLHDLYKLSLIFGSAASGEVGE